MSVWWQSADEEERKQVEEIPLVRELTNGSGLQDRAYNPEVRDVLLETLFASASDLLLFPVTDVFGWDTRINEPATVSDTNWTYRLPWPVDRLDEQPEARERSAALRRWAEQYQRAAPD
jgi:4-alpha-glucanotransferase